MDNPIGANFHPLPERPQRSSLLYTRAWQATRCMVGATLAVALAPEVRAYRGHPTPLGWTSLRALQALALWQRYASGYSSSDEYPEGIATFLCIHPRLCHHAGLPAQSGLYHHRNRG